MRRVLMIVPLAVMALEPNLVRQTEVMADPGTIVSPGGEYYISCQYGVGNTEYVPIDRFTVMTGTGDVVYEKNDMQHTILDISDQGIVVGIDFDGPVSGQADLVFYDRTGQRTGTASIGFLLGRTFSLDGSVYCVADGKMGTRVFDTEGTQRYCFDGGNTFAVSYDGRCIAVARDSCIAVYIDGEMTNTILLASPFVRQMGFSYDNTRFGFIAKKTFAVHDLSRDVQLFRYEETATDRQFISFDVLYGTAGYVCGLDRDGGRGTPDRHGEGYVYYFDDQGLLQWQDELPYERWNINVPRVQAGIERSFSVSTVDKVYDYEY